MLFSHGAYPINKHTSNIYDILSLQVSEHNTEIAICIGTVIRIHGYMTLGHSAETAICHPTYHMHISGHSRGRYMTIMYAYIMS